MTVVDRTPRTLRLVPSEFDPHHALGLLATHGDGLLAIARLVTGDVEVARVIVADVLRTAAAGGDVPPDSTRAALATATFLGCRAALEVATGTEDPPDASAPSHPIDWMARISAQQRSAIALYLHGSLTPLQIAILLNLPPRAVRRLLLAALGELAAARPARHAR